MVNKVKGKNQYTFLKTVAEATEIINRLGIDGVLDSILKGDCLEILTELPAKSVDLIHTSPPYNIAKAYKQVSDSRAREEYVKFLRQVIDQCYRVLRPNGSLFFQAGYSVDDGGDREIIPIDFLMYNEFRLAGFRLWDRVIWHYFGGMSFTRKFKNSHETIFWWVRPEKSDFSPTFDVDAVREKSRSYDKRNNLWGKNPGNVWIEDRVAFGGHGRNTSHIAVYPESVTELIIRACSRIGSLVLDPFSGSGTTPAVARSLGRRWIGIEISPDYAMESTLRVGTRQPSEWQTLASGLVKCISLRNKPQNQDLNKAVDFFGNWLKQVKLDKYRQFIKVELEKVYKEGSLDGKQVKDAKPEVWSALDGFFERSEGSHPLIYSSNILDGIFRQRSRWNSIRKYEHTVSLLDEIIRTVNSSSVEELISQLIENEPTSLGVRKRQLIFKGPPVPIVSQCNDTQETVKVLKQYLPGGEFE